MPTSTPLAAVLDTLEKLFAVIGGVSVVLSPLVLAYVKLRVHEAVKDAPAVTEIAARVTVVEKWQAEHEPTVQLVPQLSATLERIDSTLSHLTNFLVERGLEKR